MAVSKHFAGMTMILIFAALAATGCATKRFVRQQTAPLNERVDQVDKKHTEAVASLEQKMSRDVSRVEERALTAEEKANVAGASAQQADAKATEAGNVARRATDLVNETTARLGEVSNVVQNIDRYKLVNADTLLFRFDKAALTDEGKQKLDRLSEQAGGVARAVIEVQGFTDRTGPTDYNLALSRRRADTVVRYLVDKGVPLRSIQMIGLGEAPKPAGEPGAVRREAAKNMRRVAVSLYAPEVKLSVLASDTPTAQTPPSGR